jgi:hypothetical protein
MRQAVSVWPDQNCLLQGLTKPKDLVEFIISDFVCKGAEAPQKNIDFFWGSSHFFSRHKFFGCSDRQKAKTG